MSIKIDSGPAFPTIFVERDGDVFRNCYQNGMTLRDYFAAQIIPSMIIIMNEIGKNKNKIYSCSEVAREAFNYADAMLSERDK